MKKIISVTISFLLISVSLFSEVGERKGLVVPLQFLKSGQVQRPPVDDIRDAYRDVFEKWWAENSYGKFHFPTKTLGYVNVPWPKDPQGGMGDDLSEDGIFGTGQGETFWDTQIADEVYTPGERFLDLNGNGAWNGFEAFTDLASPQGRATIWDSKGERFIDINKNGIYDRATTVDLYSKQMDAADGSIDGTYNGLLANVPIVVDEFKVRESIQTYIQEQNSDNVTFGIGANAILFSADINEHFEGSDIITWDPIGDNSYMADYSASTITFVSGNTVSTPIGSDNVLTYSTANPIFTKINQNIYYQKASATDGVFNIDTVVVDIYEAGEPFDDDNGDGIWSDREPFEDYMIRWDHTAVGPSGGLGDYVMVTDEYIDNNYPGDTAALKARTNNGRYDPPEPFRNEINTKLRLIPAPTATNNSPTNWDPRGYFGSWQNWWQAAFGTDAPAWDATNYTVANVNDDRGASFFYITSAPNVGSLSGTTSGGNVLPLPSQYDGPREFRDMPSSMYHSQGDGRLGEITDPRTDRISGTDYGNNSPLGTGPDRLIEAAGPLAFNIHGDFGYDAGNQLTLEILTWRTDGHHLTDHATGHNGHGHTNVGDTGHRFTRDANLDGYIDQGETVDHGFNNYLVDLDPATPDGGAVTNYPYNRVRLMEDLLEAIDAVEDLDSFSEDGKTIDYLIGLYPSGYPGGGFQGMDGLRWSVLNRDKDGYISGSGQPGEMGSDFAMGLVAHEAGHDFQGWPDLYDYDTFNGIIVNRPIGGFDIMATGGFVHSLPITKRSAGWTGIQNLKDYLIPGIPRTLDLWPVEKNENQYFYFGRSEDNIAERFWLWYESGDSVQFSKGFAANEEGRIGMILMHEESGWDHENDDLHEQQRHSGHFQYEIIAADGENHMSDNLNNGDDGDPFPGSTNRFSINNQTVPSTRWFDQVDSNLEILNMNLPGDFTSPMKVTFLWKDRSVPELTFITPPGGKETSAGYQIELELFDLHGGSTIGIYRDNDKQGYDGALVVTLEKNPGVIRSAINDVIDNLPDGDYHYYALLTPGTSEQGLSELSISKIFAGTDNAGSGNVTFNQPILTSIPVTTSHSTLQTWILTNEGDDQWSVRGSVTGLEPNLAVTNQAYSTSSDYTGLHFTISHTIGAPNFIKGDIFSFKTTGLTAYSQPIEVVNGNIPLPPESPRIKVSPITGNTSESGFSSSFKVVLTQEPTSLVTIPVESTDTTEGRVSVTELKFDKDNWDQEQMVIIYGVNDDHLDGNIDYEIRLETAVSLDPAFNGENPENLKLVNVDDETNQTVSLVHVTSVTGSTDEGGGETSFEVVLLDRPTSDVIIPLKSDDTGEGTIAQIDLVFTVQNWNAPQTVTVEGVDDEIVDGDEIFNIVFDPISSFDTRFDTLILEKVQVLNVDDDEDVTNEDPTPGNEEEESGGEGEETTVVNEEGKKREEVIFQRPDLDSAGGCLLKRRVARK